MVTIKELAKLAGVSTTTVSNVIHGKTKKVSPDTIKKINLLIQEKGYVQKMGLRILNQESSQLIAVVVNSHRDFSESILGDPFYGQIIGLIEELVQKSGYYLMFYSAKDMNKIFQMVMGWNVDGVIAISFSKRNCEKIYHLTQKPVVSIDSYGESSLPGETQITNIGLDDESGGYLMTKHLLEYGYEHIKLCAGRDSGVDHLRYLGSQRAMHDYAKPSQKLQFIALGTDKGKRRSSYDWILQRMEPKTALFCLSDLYALEILNFFHDKNIIVPKQVGVAGYDGIQFTEFSNPRLTTIKQDIHQKAYLAVQTLIEKIQIHDSLKTKDIKLPVSLIIRQSTAHCSIMDNLTLAQDFTS